MLFDSISLVEGSELNNIVVPQGDSFPENANSAELFFRTDENQLYVYSNTEWVAIGAAGSGTGVTNVPKITNVYITDSSYADLGTTFIELSGGYIKVVGSNFSTGAIIVLDNQILTTTVVNSSQLTAAVPAKVEGKYTLLVVNSDGGATYFAAGLQYSAPPDWITGSALQPQNAGTSVSIQLSALNAVSYELNTGSTLPVGLSLSTSGLISGLLSESSNTTTYSFTVKVTDAESQTALRTFSLKVSAINVSSVSIVDSSYSSIDDTAVSTSGGYIKITGIGFEDGCSVSIEGTASTSVTFVSSTEINAQVPAKAAGTYSLTVTNPAGDAATKTQAVVFSGAPVWVTSATLPLQYTDSAISIQLSASSATSYSLKAGSSLPSGLTLSSGGLISGSTTISDTTLYTFTVIATDAENQDTEQEFSLRISVMSIGTVYVTDSTYTNLDDTAVDVTGGYIKVTGNGFKAGCVLTIGGVTAISTTYVGNTEIRAQVAATSEGTYAITVTNTDGDLATKSSAVAFSPSPAWTTATSLPDQTEDAAVSIQLSASLATSYTLADGSTLPTGLTLSSSGLISGTVTGITAIESYSFTVIATDAENQSTSRTFALAVIPAVDLLTARSNTKLTSLLLKSSAVDGANTLAFEDASSNNFAITRAGNATETSISPFNPSGWSTYFDGSGDYLYSSATMPSGTENFCIETWFYIENSLSYLVTGSTAYVARLVSGVGTGSLEIQILSASGSTSVPSVLTISSYASASLQFNVSNLTIPVNAWNHVAFVRQGSLFAIYLNGQRVGTTTNTTSLTASNVRIGGAADAATGYLNYLKGYLSNVRIVKGSSVYDPMVPQFKVPTAPLTAIPGTTLLTCNSNSQVDTSTTRATTTVNGDAAIKAFSPFTTFNATQNSLEDGSVYFDGSGDYLSIADNANLELGSSNFTIEAWIYLTVASGEKGIFSKYSTGNVGFTIRYSASNGGIRSVFGNSGGTTDIWVETWTPSANTWYHVAFVRSSNSYYVFVNGTQIGTTRTFTNAITIGDTSDVFLIGTTQTVASSDFAGYISNARIVKDSALYTANFTPSTSPLTAVSGTSLLTCQNSQIKDASSNNFTITRNGDAKYSVMGPFRSASSGSSVYFDGTGDYLTLPTGNSALAFGNSNFTVEAWVYRVSGTGQATIFVGQSDLTTAAGSSYVFYIAPSHTTDLYIGTTAYAITSPNPPLGSWNHVAWVRNGGTFTSYLNGVQVGNRTDLGTGSVNIGSATAPPAIGAFSSGINSLNGYISNLRVVKGTALYTSNFTPSTQPLTAVSSTSLLTCQSSAIVDNSSNAFAITRNGNARVINAGPFVSSANDTYTFKNPMSGGSVYFDGTGDYLSITRNSAFLPIANEDFTIEAWVNPTAVPGVQGAQIVGLHEYGLSSDWIIIINSSRQVDFFVNGVSHINTSETIKLNSWNHVAVTRSGTSSDNLKVFVNGIAQSFSRNTTTITVGSNNLSIGADQNGDEANLTGYISNVRIVRGTALYTSNFIPSTTALTAVSGTSLLTCQNGTITDASSNAFAITAVGNASASSLGPFSLDSVSGSAYSVASPSGSMYFDGTGDYLTVASGSESTMSFGSGDFTLEAWIYLTVNTASTIFSNRCWFNVTGTSIGLTQAGIVGIVSATIPSIMNTWTHVAATRSGTTFRLFVNGVLQNSATASITFDNIGTRIGIEAGSLIQPFNGYISNLRAVKGTALYTANFTPSTSPLTAVAGTTLLTCQGNGFKDASPNNFTFTPSGDVKPAGVTPFDVPTLGKSVYFDGAGDYIQVANNTGFNFGSGDFTVEAWVNPTSVTGYGCIMSYANGSAQNSNYEFVIYRNGATWQTQIYSGTTAYGPSAAGTATINKWTHVAMARSGTNLYTFIDGILTNTTSVTGVTANSPSGATLQIGIGHGGLYVFSGYISNLRIVKGTAVYTASFTPSTSPLTAVSGTSLLTCQSSAIVDNSGNALAITRFGDSKTTDFTPYTLPAKSSYAGSVYFDGTGDSLSIPDNEAFNFGAGNFTVECWVNINNIASSPWIFSQWQSTTNTDVTSAFNIAVSASKISAGCAYGSSISQFALQSISTISNGQWYHIALVRNGAKTSLYLNGIEQASNTTLGTSAVNNSTVPVLLGARTGGTGYLNGHISNARIVKGTAVYTASFVPPTGPLAAIPGTVFLLDNSSPGIYDATQKVAIETSSTAANIRTSSTVKKFEGSTYFNGTASSMLTLPSVPELNVGNGAFTVEFWFYNTHTTWLKSMDFTDGASGALAIYVGSDGILRYAPQMSSSKSLGSISSLALNTWHHFAIVKSNNQMVAYVNGVALSAPVADTQTFSAITKIGGSQDGYIIGYIEDLRVVKGQAVYTTTFTPPATALTV